MDIEILTVGDLDFMNWYQIEIKSSLTEPCTLTKTINGRLFVADQLSHVAALDAEAYQFTFDVVEAETANPEPE